MFKEPYLNSRSNFWSKATTAALVHLKGDPSTKSIRNSANKVVGMVLEVCIVDTFSAVSILFCEKYTAMKHQGYLNYPITLVQAYWTCPFHYI